MHDHSAGRCLNNTDLMKRTCHAAAYEQGQALVERATLHVK